MGFNSVFKGLKCPLTLILLTWRIWWANNASKWQMEFNSAFKGLKCPLTLILLTWRIWWAPNNASRWQIEFNLVFKGLKCPLTLILLTWRIWWAPNNASKWQMEFNLVFKGLKSFSFMKSEGSLLCMEEPASGRGSEPDGVNFRAVQASCSNSTRSPFVTLLSWRTQSGTWSSFRKRLWFTESHTVLFISFLFGFFCLLNLFLI